MVRGGTCYSMQLFLKRCHIPRTSRKLYSKPIASPECNEIQPHNEYLNTSSSQYIWCHCEKKKIAESIICENELC